jgi:hypothetical protein
MQMNKLPKEIPAAFPNPALELEELEEDIRSALVRIWLIQGLVLVAGLGAAAWIVAQQLLR